MIFLIDYDRRSGRLITIRSFQESEQDLAESARLKIELEHNRHRINREVVILQAASMEALRRTHRRYFGDLEDLVHESGLH